MGTATVTSEAWFVDKATTPTPFTAGTVDLTATPASSVLTAANMAHGDVITAPLTVKNSGTLGLRYTMEAQFSGALAPALVIEIKTGVATCTTAGFTATGTRLYGPASPSSTDDRFEIFGDKAEGPDLGDRVLATNAQETFCVQVRLPLSTNNSYSNKSASATFNLFSEQTKNNDTLQIMNPAGAGNAQTLLDATLNANQANVTVSWPASDDRNITGYVVSRTTNNGASWATVASLDGRTTDTFVDTNLTHGNTYGYALQAVGFDGTTTSLPRTPSPTATVTVPWTQPQAATATAVAISGLSVEVTWTKSPSVWVDGYNIMRSVDGGSTWTYLTRVPAAATSYVDTTPPLGKDVTYRVHAITADGQVGANPHPTGADKDEVSLQYQFTQKPLGGGLAGVTRGDEGLLYVTNRSGVLFKITRDGTVSTLASGLGSLYGVTPGSGGVYVADCNDGGVLHRIDATGKATVVASNLGFIQGLTRGLDGNFYTVDATAGTLKKITPSGAVTTVTTGLGSPYGVAPAGDGSLYVVDFDGGVLYRVTPSGTKTVITAGLVNPHGVEVDVNQQVYVTEFGLGSVGGRVLRVQPTG